MKLQGWNLWSVALAMFVSLSAQAADSDKIAPDLRINPIVIVAEYSMGDCTQMIPDDVLLRLVPLRPDNDERVRDQPNYKLCRTLPQALRDELAERGFDVELKEFVTQPLESKAYNQQSLEFRANTVNAEENKGRYVLSYNGVFEAREGSFTYLSLQGPAADGKRTSLGTFKLETEQLHVTNYNGASGQMSAGVALPPKAVAKLIANSLEQRCDKHGFFKRCADRLHLVAPK